MCAIEREREGVPDRGGLVHLLRRRQLLAADHQHPPRGLHPRERYEHTRQRAEIFVRAAYDARDIGDKLRLFIPEQRLGDRSSWPGIGGQVIDPEGRSGLQGVAAAGELKNDGASALDGGHGMVMKHRKQVIEPVRGREGLEQAGLA
jgi:hypothetical protein